MICGAAVLAGYVSRRVLPALAAALAVAIGLGFAGSNLRRHYLPPLKTSSLDHVTGSQDITQWWTKGALRVSNADLNGVLQAAGIGQINAGGNVTVGPGDGTDPVTYLVNHGYTQWTSYQPSGRYWTFQWIEFGWLAALAVVLLTATLLLVRRRDA